MNKLSIEVHGSQEAPKVSDIYRWWPVFNNLYLFWINSDALSIHNVTQIGNKILAKETLGELCFELMGPKGFQKLLHM